MKGNAMALLRMAAVKKELGYRSNASIYNAMNDGLFTKPVKIGTRSSAWPENEVKAIVASLIASKTPVEIRELVERLHAQRANALKTVEGMAA
jgi:prophage regulatory protein